MNYVSWASELDNLHVGSDFDTFSFFLLHKVNFTDPCEYKSVFLTNDQV